MMLNDVVCFLVYWIRIIASLLVFSWLLMFSRVSTHISNLKWLLCANVFLVLPEAAAMGSAPMYALTVIRINIYSSTKPNLYIEEKNLVKKKARFKIK
jgi:hypothetical protein